MKNLAVSPAINYQIAWKKFFCKDRNSNGIKREKTEKKEIQSKISQSDSMS